MTWAAVEAVLKAGDPKAIAFDGCHKIYVLMDAAAVTAQRSYGYEHVVEVTDPDNALATLHDWYDESCGLQFISAVRTVKGDPNKGYTQLIEQGEEA